MRLDFFVSRKRYGELMALADSYVQDYRAALRDLCERDRAISRLKGDIDQLKAVNESFKAEVERLGCLVRTKDKALDRIWEAFGSMAVRP